MPTILVVQHQDDCPPALVGEWLIEAGCTLDVRRPYAGDPLPGDLREHDAVFVLGGSMGADDDAVHPWLAPTKELIRLGAAGGVPVLGSCLGHQLCAVALGGAVEANPQGPQIGVTAIGWSEAAESDRLCAGLTDRAVAVHWNNDVVTDLPGSAVVLARAPRGEVQAVRLAPTVWGIQWHPEVDDALVAPWADDDRDRYVPGHVDALVREIRDRAAELARWRGLAEAFVGVARERAAVSVAPATRGE